ncbi:hypothetical protein [Terrisporobacter glycolicus]|uniref:hypothetical protein n=1 Tax=Terrisporobacter glycolicus TaxID=36841 RepID=UPI003464A761
MSFSFRNFIIYPLVYIIFMPVLAFIHELGHAIPALIFTKNEVSVNIGNYNLIKKIFNGILLCSIGQFIVTALPMKYSDNGPYKGFTSDGYKIEQWLKMKNTN